MKDPFPVSPIPWLADLVQPWSDRLNMVTLPLHIHEVLFAALLYTLIFWPISPMISNYFAPEHYSKLSRKRRLNWDAHVVSMAQSCLINALAIWVIWTNDERRTMDWEDRIWGYDGACALIQSLATGYFVWDLFVTSFNLDVFGIGTLAHAISALLVYSLGYRPLVNYYSPVFILWELSTPFLNIHWFMDKMNMTGTRAQLYNGLMLLFTFFTSRLVFGTYSSYRAMSDFFLAVQSPPSLEKLGTATMMHVSQAAPVPIWAALSYVASNSTLQFLNCYWFWKMIAAVRKRFVSSKEPAELVTEAEVDLSSVASGIMDQQKQQQPKRRKA